MIYVFLRWSSCYLGAVTRWHIGTDGSKSRWYLLFSKFAHYHASLAHKLKWGILPMSNTVAHAVGRLEMFASRVWHTAHYCGYVVLCELWYIANYYFTSVGYN